MAQSDTRPQPLMSAAPSPAGLLPGAAVAAHGSAEECRLRNDRQTYFKLVRELVQAQFVLADAELGRRLWQEVADRDLDTGRIIQLMYGCWFHNNDDEMRELDDAYLALIDPAETATL